MAKKYYVVWAGRETGVFDNWPHTKRLVDGFAGARYKSFPTKAEADAAFAGSATARTTSTRNSNFRTARKAPANKVVTAVDRGQFNVEIFCDGGCDPNPGQAGSGVSVYRDGTLSELWYGLYNPSGTNNTAELNALYQALLIARDAVSDGLKPLIRCDSKYSIDCVTNWAFSWKAKGWKRKVEGDIKNLEIIQQAHALFVALQADITVEHVKAHVGIEGNELADRMTMVAVSRKESEFVRYPDLDVSAILALRTG